MFFRGRHVHTIDNKGRLSIPAAFRSELAARSEKPPVITNVKNCLALYPQEDWLEIEETLAGASQLRPEVQAYQRFVISGAVEAPIDGQGRIVIPPHLREHARLEREVTIAGVGPRIEVWDKALFDQDLQSTVSHFDEISSVVAEAGRTGE
jgi:MraZ protein